MFILSFKLSEFVFRWPLSFCKRFLWMRPDSPTSAKHTSGSLMWQWSWEKWFCRWLRNRLHGFWSMWSDAIWDCLTIQEHVRPCDNVFRTSWRTTPLPAAFRTTSQPPTGLHSFLRIWRLPQWQTLASPTRAHWTRNNQRLQCVVRPRVSHLQLSDWGRDDLVFLLPCFANLQQPRAFAAEGLLPCSDRTTPLLQVGAASFLVILRGDKPCFFVSQCTVRCHFFLLFISVVWYWNPVEIGLYVYFHAQLSVLGMLVVLIA